MPNDTNDDLPDLEEELGFWQAFIGSFLIMPIMAPFIYLAVLPFTFYRAWILTILWRWFVTPVFNYPNLQLGYAFGFLLIINFLKSASLNTSKTKFSKDKTAMVLACEIILPICTLIVGWAVKTFLCT
jgi:hypothetical protein